MARVENQWQARMKTQFFILVGCHAMAPPVATLVPGSTELRLELARPWTGGGHNSELRPELAAGLRLRLELDS